MPDNMEIPKTMGQRWTEDSGWTFDASKAFDPAENDKLRKEFWAAPRDPRFPQQNKTKWCWQYYLDYHRCTTLKGEDYKPCQFFQNVYMDVCPRFWVNNWDDWVAEGRFPAKFDR